MGEHTPDRGGPPSWFQAISTRKSILTQPDAVLQRYGKAVRSYLVVLVGEDDADDVVSEIAIKVLQGRFARWEADRGRFRDFLKRAVHNAAVDFLRKKGREQQAKRLEEVPELTSSPADVWLVPYRGDVLEGAFKRLKTYQEQTPGNVFYTLVQLLTEDTGDDSEQLAVRLTGATRRPFAAVNVRKQKERARRKLAKFLLEEVCQTLEEPTPQRAEEELQALGLMVYVADFLPPDWQTRGELTPEDEQDDSGP